MKLETPDPYGYDGYGSLVWDANKQIAHIT